MLCADAATPGELGLRGNGRLAAVVPNPGDVLLLSESGFPRCPLIFSPALCFQTSQRKQNTKVTVTGVACSRRTRAPRLFAAHSRPRRATHLRGPARWTPRLQSLGSTERRRASPACVRMSTIEDLIN